jgi:ribosomal protein L22
MMAEENPDTTSEEEAVGTTETAATEAPEPKASAAVESPPEADATPEPTAPAKKPAARKPAAAKKPAAGTRAKPTEKPAPIARIEVSAHAKYVRTSARKARLVCDHIRGKSVEEAYAILAHTQRHVAEDWQKLLHSAVANAEHNHELVGEDLRIAAVHADEGPTLKRFRPRAMGRASSIRKRTSHLSITLTPKEQ